jgi:signal transduction histidine kinase
VSEAPPPAAAEWRLSRALEAFTNIVQHSEASRCAIRIKLEDGSLLLEVSDNGKGISSRMKTGVGLTSMRERAGELGGEYSIENIPGGGTRVRARLPLEAAEV